MAMNVQAKDSPTKSKESRRSVESREAFKHVIHLNDKPTDPMTTQSGVDEGDVKLSQVLVQTTNEAETLNADKVGITAKGHGCKPSNDKRRDNSWQYAKKSEVGIREL